VIKCSASSHFLSPSVLTAIHFNLTMSNSTSNSTSAGLADHNLYGYNPSKSAAYAFVALFGLSGLAHFIAMFPFRAAFFIPLILGCASKIILSLHLVFGSMLTSQ
jgi:hypothetical protein